jgi:hypothetical protein
MRKALWIIAVALSVPTMIAQQTATPQAPQANPAPCTQSQAKPPKWIHSQVPTWLQQKINKIQSKTGQGVDANQAAQEATKPAPCPAPKPAPKPTPDQSQKPAPVPQAPAANAKPVLVCPPRTVLIANTQYCLAADHTTTVDAIPLPPGMLADPAKPTQPNH